MEVEFEVEVGLFYKSGMSKRDAIMEAIKKNPKAHGRYLDRVNAGGNDFLPDVFKSIDEKQV